jgi:GT2 family glycosyltransferase
MNAKSSGNMSIIILSFNTRKTTDKCLTLLSKSVRVAKSRLGVNVEVVVVDNASSDGSKEMIKKKHPWVKLMASSKNLGFAKGNNLGIKKTKYGNLLLMNSDVFVQEDTIYKIHKYVSKDRPNALSFKLIYPDGGFQPCGGYLPTPLRMFLWSLGAEGFPFFGKLFKPIHLKNKEFYKDKGYLEWGSGAFFFIKKEIFEKVGMFDENVVLYGEDVELGKRIKDAGFCICYTPEIEVVHIGGASSKGMNSNILLLQLKGMLYYQKKHHPKTYALVEKSLLLGINLRRFLYRVIGESEKSLTYKNAYAKLFV